VTTKEGEFARLILDAWGVRLADIEGKEAGVHKCDNLRALIAAHVAAHGRRPTLWFVDDRLATPQPAPTPDGLGAGGPVPCGLGVEHRRDARIRGGHSRAPARAGPIPARPQRLVVT